MGCFHTVPRRIKIGEGVYNGGIGADVAVHPDYRNTGISNKMNELTDEQRKRADIRFLYIETGNTYLLKRSLRLYPRF